METLHGYFSGKIARSLSFHGIKGPEGCSGHDRSHRETQGYREGDEKIPAAHAYDIPKSKKEKHPYLVMAKAGWMRKAIATG
jgi:hypothetical protein